MKKLLIIGTPLALLVAVLAVVGVVFALNNGGDTRQDAAAVIQPVPTAAGGPVDTVKVGGTIEYWVRDAQGNLKEHEVLHNATTAAGANTAMDALFDDTFVLASTAGEAYLKIGAMSGPTPGTACDSNVLNAVSAIGTNPQIDNDSTTSGTAAITNATVVGGTSTRVVSVTFTVPAGQTPLIQEIRLFKVSVASAATFTAAADANAVSFACRDVNITLGAGDVVTFNWTVNLVGNSAA